ncbi:MAG: hypothetical protein ABJA82_14870 [Myxococcales bacterium]
MFHRHCPSAGFAMGIVTALTGASCYSTQAQRAPGLDSLRQPNQSREILLAVGQQGRIRIRPGSLVRFRRVDGASTSWVEATRVRLTPEVIVVDRGQAGSQVLHWTEVAGVEVNDLDVGLTIVGVAAGATLTMVAAVTEVVVVAALESVHIRVHEVGLTRATVDALMSATGRHIDDDPMERRLLAEEGDVALAEVMMSARPLFSTEARRRDLLRASLAIDSGVVWEQGLPLTQVGVMGSFRLLNILELGLGVGMADVGPPAGGRPPPAISLGTAPPVDRVRVTGRGRLGLHLDLDAARRVALFLGQEVGVSSGGWVDTRTIWGVRFRLSDRWELGLLPFNPRVSWPQPNGLSMTAYASSLELAWVL